MSVGIVGAGAFCTALAVSLSCKYSDVILWGRDPNHMCDLKLHRENGRNLAGAVLPKTLTPTADFSQVAAQQTLQQLVRDRADFFNDQVLVACCKGIEQTSNLGPLAVLQDTVQNC